MKAFDSFPSDFEYDEYLSRQDAKGNLPDTTVEGEPREAMLAQLFDPELPEGVYLEVGPGTVPYCETSTRDFTRLHYVGIDGGKSEYNEALSSYWYMTEYDETLRDGIFAKGRSLSLERKTPLATFLCGDARRLPFPDKDRPALPEESRDNALPIRETFMRNVLMASNTHPRSVERIFREQARVLAADGLMVIRETDLYHSRHLFGTGRSARFLSLLANLERTGFTKRMLLFDTDPAYDELIKQFPGGDDRTYQFGGYYLIAQQGEKIDRTKPETPGWGRMFAGLADKVFRRDGGNA